MLGLLNQGFAVEEMFDVLPRADKKDLRKFVRFLLRCDDPVIQQAVKGLSPSFGADLPYGRVIACRLCGARLIRVPCGNCCRKHIPPQPPTKRKPHATRPKVEPPPSSPTHPTTHAAGTVQRIEVYRRRVARNERVFHEEDVKLVAVRERNPLPKEGRNERGEKQTSAPGD